MNKQLLLTFSLALAGWMPAIGQGYAFQLKTAGYHPLENPVLLSDPFDPWDDDEWLLPIGFSFGLFGETYEELLLWQGSLYFGGDSVFLDAFGASLIDRSWHNLGLVSLSPISYQLDGAPGERIFKIEYERAGFWDGALADSISFQIWLHEGKNLIEVRIGPGMVDPQVYQVDGWDGPYIGLANLKTDQYLYLEGDPAMPDLYTDDDNTEGLLGTPAEGTVYRFFPDTLLLGTARPAAPDPLELQIVAKAGVLSVADLPPGNWQRATLYDGLGRGLRHWSLAGSRSANLLLPELTAGFYWVTLSDGRQLAVGRFWAP
ncbi:MAG: hypothetical protein KDC43_12630 [Saprospiraceae bacterium]|nr:hypothetical protein [Saprospiraceae bacterium]MCB0624725.1 hypothetical protein [Saprospiraceae bacterium]MCB0677355.1 hypothetical protein [Saprospiraceae bacterium]MCB0679803.1 hypothetical protein [Saprospiraceae bacterium]